MANTFEGNNKIEVVGKSWVIDLPDEFTSENNLDKDTKILLTFKENERVEAEILSPLSEKLKKISEKILKKRRALYEELKRVGD